ncbi:MAG: 4-hydroxy-tetrahydrodipicolinate synthase [Anaerolineae bacterium]
MNKKPKWFKGIFPALVTPFTRDGKVDEAAFRALIRRVLPHVNGIVPCGTTGEFVYLTAEERKRVVEVALDEVAGRVPVVAGTGAPSTRETLELTEHARAAGATAALIVAPFYLKPSFNEVYDHFRAVNDAVDLPIILYNIPQCAGTHFRWWTAEGMAFLDHVVGIKDSSGDIPFLMALFEKIKGVIGIFTGHDETVAAALAAGADGAILASANLIPDIWQEIYQAVQAGDLARAQTRQAEVQKLVRIVVRKGSTQAVKEGLRLLGLDVGDSRHPIMPGGAFEREDYEELRTQLEHLGKASTPAREVSGAMAAHSLQGDLTLRVGEGFSGPPFHEVAHVDLLLGRLDGPVGRAIARALEEGRPGHEVQVIEEHPKTLLVPTVSVRTKRQRELLYEDAVAGVRLAIAHSIQDGFLPAALLGEIGLIANVFVHPGASIRKRVEFNNYKAMRAAIRKAIEGRPTLEEVLHEKEAARHPFRYAP